MRPPFLLTLCLLAACTSPPEVSAPPPPSSLASVAALDYRVPRSDIPVIELDVGDRGRFLFIIDTGANQSAVYLDWADEMGAVSTNDTSLVIRSLTGIENRPVAKLDALRIGDRRYDDLPVALLERRRVPPNIAGVLGTDILTDFALLFDPATGQVHFLDPAHFDASLYAAWDRVPLSNDRPRDTPFKLWFGETRFGDDIFPVLIDTGADFSVMNWPAALRRQNVDAVYQTLLDEWKIAGAVGEFRPSMALIVDNLVMGEHRWGAPRFIVLDLEALDNIGAHEEPMLIAGANMFWARRYVIDFAGEQLLIDPEGPHLEYEQADPGRDQTRHE